MGTGGLPSLVAALLGTSASTPTPTADVVAVDDLVRHLSWPRATIFGQDGKQLGLTAGMASDFSGFEERPLHRSSNVRTWHFNPHAVRCQSCLCPRTSRRMILVVRHILSIPWRACNQGQPCLSKLAAIGPGPGKQRVTCSLQLGGLASGLWRDGSRGAANGVTAQEEH